jgi:hypothetical protein
MSLRFKFEKKFFFIGLFCPLDKVYQNKKNKKKKPKRAGKLVLNLEVINYVTLV